MTVPFRVFAWTVAAAVCFVCAVWFALDADWPRVAAGVVGMAACSWLATERGL